ncbi:MAG: hypothetical protein Q4D07_03405 [Selenomonadaceae bacterium]|nr:hypothetical protein [Selenomonadaceae bacterium]
MSYSLKPEEIYKEVGAELPPHRYDLITLVMVNLSTEEKGSENELLGMLTELFSGKTLKEKGDTLQNKYGVVIDDGVGKELADMCNFSAYEREQGRAEGIEKGKLEVALGMLKEKLSLDMIARITKLPTEKIIEVATANGLSVC